LYKQKKKKQESKKTGEMGSH